MAVSDKNIIVYGSATMPDTDATLDIGGAISTAKKPIFTPLSISGLVQYISSSAGDVTQTITVSYLDNDNVLQTEAKLLTGQTAVAGVATMKTLEKALKSAACAGDVAVEAATAERTGTCQAGSIADTIVFDSGASSVDDAYKHMIVRTTGGTGPNQIREILSYVGSSKKAKVSRNWTITPDGTTTFRISRGMLFDLSPVEITEVRRVFYDAVANVIGGATKTYYEKVFFKNTHATDGVSSGTIILSADPNTVSAFGVAPTLDDSGTNGAANNRQVAPAGITFDTAIKNIVGGGTLAAGTAQGVWLKLTLAAGLTSVETTTSYVLQGVV